MMSASHLPIAPTARPVSKRSRQSPRALLAELGDVLWLSYYHLVDRWRRSQLDGFVARPVRTIDLATLDGHRLTLPARPNRAEVHVLSLPAPVPAQAPRPLV
ncbi:hypothetical protein [Lentzea sp. E54]|uniref:hypothetical protein n=1 Tax=Lentzea xerophila TaxID=3435883 RepID=UPI003DA26D87